MGFFGALAARIAVVLSTEPRETADGRVLDVKVDPGGGANVTSRQFSSPGDDSVPLPGDTALQLPGPGAGREQTAGYADTANAKKAGPGEKRGYARDSDGNPVCEVWCKADGSIVLEVLKSGGAPIEINTTGTVILNSPDVRVGDSAGRPLARVGDLIVGALQALSSPPGQKIAPVPPATPTATGGVPFAAQIVSGSASAKG